MLRYNTIHTSPRKSHGFQNRKATKAAHVTPDGTIATETKAKNNKLKDDLPSQATADDTNTRNTRGCIPDCVSGGPATLRIPETVKPLAKNRTWSPPKFSRKRVVTRTSVAAWVRYRHQRVGH
jgi:hypothetical protein